MTAFLRTASPPAQIASQISDFIMHHGVLTTPPSARPPTPLCSSLRWPRRRPLPVRCRRFGGKFERPRSRVESGCSLDAEQDDILCDFLSPPKLRLASGRPAVRSVGKNATAIHPRGWGRFTGKAPRADQRRSEDYGRNGGSTAMKPRYGVRI